MLKLFKKILKPEIIKAPVVAINGDEVKSYDTDEEAAKKVKIELIKRDYSGTKEVKERKNNNF